MLRGICIVQTHPRKRVLEHADYVAPTQQRQLDHTDQEYTYPAWQIYIMNCNGNRSYRSYRSSVRAVNRNEWCRKKRYWSGPTIIRCQVYSSSAGGDGWLQWLKELSQRENKQKNADWFELESSNVCTAIYWSFELTISLQKVIVLGFRVLALPLFGHPLFFGLVVCRVSYEINAYEYVLREWVFAACRVPIYAG